MPRSPRLYAVLLGSALVAAPGMVAASSASAEVPEISSVALVGSLQTEIGCAEDWDPACEASELVREGSSWTATFPIPEGTFELKVAMNDSWDVNYGAGGALGGANIPLVLEGPATLEFRYDEVTHLVTFTPKGLAGGTSPGDAALAADSLRAPLTRERFYFVMADRFANGSTANDEGGLTGGPLTTGFDPTHKGFYHGGDLKGISQKLDYIKDMGTTAIWLTPSFKNKPVQGESRSGERRLPRLLDHRLHADRPPPRHQRGHEGAHRRRPRQGDEGLLRHHHEPHRGRHRLRGEAVHLPVQEELPLRGHRRHGVRRPRLHRQAGIRVARDGRGVLPVHPVPPRG